MSSTLHDASLVAENTDVIQQIDPLFDVLSSTVPYRSDLVRLAAGTLAAVRIPSHLPADRCAELVRALDDCEFDTYDERRIFPPVTKLGPAVFDYYLDDTIRAEYWEHAEQSRRTWKRIVGDNDPLDMLISELRLIWQGPVEPATVGGRELFVGMVRELTGGARMHFDELMREFPGVVDQELVAQFGFNCYISVPEDGGDLVVYRRRWKPSDERERIGYGWSERVAADEPRVMVKPEVGDSVWFDSRNFHAITPNTAGRRLSISFFCGVTPENKLVLWS
ncbi:2OG-Fe(II) oxygenase [Streptomyces sp. ASQP_92]|uniref:2OG-Fe(II) oxygenase n=1 Tax=unclassified Streptomyces TaxID=2593676 RepID=UPI0021C1A9D3|nr:2OG-Fe(II) oxygenase [Streptomyces sp. ASQP_92]MCT9093208.1 2OG-Fe(II) oxygenase [Streptomyces sp. ASQP_92]